MRCMAVVFCAWLLAPAFAFAETCAETEAGLIDAGYEATLQVITPGCLGQGEDKGSSLVDGLLQIDPNEDLFAARIYKIRELMQVMLEFSNLQAQGESDKAAWLALSEGTRKEIVIAKRVNAQNTKEQNDAFLLQLFSPGSWEINAEFHAGIVDGLTLTQPDVAACPLPASVECGPYKSRKELIRYLVVASQIRSYALRDSWNSSVKSIELRDTKWNAYFNDALFQWWWEVGINGYRMKHSDLCKRGPDGMQKGFCEVPSSQLIVLHPDVGLQWVNGARQSSDLKAAVIIEVFGRNSWRWSQKGEIQGASGWSAIAAYSDLDGISKWRYGLLYHGKSKYSFAVTAGNGKFGLLMNLALSDRLFEVSEKYQGYFKDPEKTFFDALTGKQSAKQ